MMAFNAPPPRTTQGTVVCRPDDLPGNGPADALDEATALRPAADDVTSVAVLQTPPPPPTATTLVAPGAPRRVKRLRVVDDDDEENQDVVVSKFLVSKKQTNNLLSFDSNNQTRLGATIQCLTIKNHT